MTILQLNQLSLRLGQRTLWQDLSLSLQLGERWVLLGNNGVGKSQLLDVLCGWRWPSTGTITLQGQDLRNLPPLALSTMRACMTQELKHSFSLSLHDWLHFDCQHNPQPWIAALDLQALLTQDVLTLSGGELQRAHLARTLNKQAPLLLLDEPISQLDPKHQQLVLHLLKSLQGCLTITVVHDYRWARSFATHALLLFDDGHFEAGSAAQLLTNACLERLYGVSMEDAIPQP